MAPSSLPYVYDGDNDEEEEKEREDSGQQEMAGWGVFSLMDRPRGRPLLWGDVVIQVTDLNETYVHGFKLLIHDYLWDAAETGGQYEGQDVMSVVPGIGMLANGLPNNLHNALFFVPSVDEGGLTRIESPGAGAISHYHNLTFFTFQNITAGAEILVNFGSNWYRERADRGLFLPSVREGLKEKQVAAARDVDWLRREGRCLDNMKPGRSALPHAGRGVFATRPLAKGTIVAPMSILPITDRRAMDITRKRQDGTYVETKQLLLNYCLGHPNSSMLFYPYSPMVNLVNHGAGQQANVQLQWSQSTVLHKRGLDWLKGPVELIRNSDRSGLLLELVATRDIDHNEEILMDYGPDWDKAWKDHMQRWTPTTGAEFYLPSFVQDDTIKALRTEEELSKYPYPDNLFTSCFYRYADHKEAAERQQQQQQQHSSSTVTTFPWKATRGLFELRYLRPCRILQRQQEGQKGGTRFKVQILNRFGLPLEERIPRGVVHIVTNVPRHAVRFSDKLYTTDQHLLNAFRHEIGFPDDLFPEQWKDLKGD